MRLKLSALYAILIIMLCLCVFFLFFSVPEPVETVEEEPEEYVTVREEIREKETNGLTPDFASLQATNEDFVCWLRIPNTTISYPVVLGENNSFYLNHSFSGQESGFGCPFVDTRTPPEGDCLMIHGHNMGYNREEMFSPLVLLQDPTYSANHQRICLAFPGEDGEREYTLFAVGNFDVVEEPFDFYQSGFATKEDRSAFLSYFSKRSLYVSDQTETEEGEGQILILSTCNNLYGENNRLLILAIENDSLSEN